MKKQVLFMVFSYVLYIGGMCLGTMLLSLLAYKLGYSPQQIENGLHWLSMISLGLMISMLSLIQMIIDKVKSLQK